MHRGGDASLDDLEWKRGLGGAQAYSDSKLHDVILPLQWRAVRDVLSNALEPGGRTKMAARVLPTIWQRPETSVAGDQR